MGKGGQGVAAARETFDPERPLKWEEIRKHNREDDAWLVLENKVYDVTEFKQRHPGGWKVLEDHSGQDSTIPFLMYHTDGSLPMVRRFMKPLQIGVLDEPTYSRKRDQGIEEDFRKLWKTAKDMDLFTPSFFCSAFEFSQIFIFEALTYFILSYFGTGWLPYLAACVMCGATMMRAGYCMHDYGHRALTHTRWDHWLQVFCMGVTAGFSSNFWNEYHSRHHAKPNKHGKDPAINMNEHLYVIGTVMAKEKAQENRKDGKANIPYNHQHKYWFLLGPPLYMPVVFQMVSVLYAIRRRKYDDLLAFVLFIAKNMWLYSPMLGVGWTLGLLFLGKQVMSHWFVWVSLSSHMPLPQEYEPVEGYTWFETQAGGTCNLPATYFSDWYTGHVNWQIEHHLFPTMPRENNRYIAPLVKEMCEKYDIPYLVKPSLYQAFYDVYAMFKKSGKEWYVEYYNEYMSAMAGN